MKLFKNKEVRNTLLLCTLVFILFTIIFTFFINYCISSLNSAQIKQNTTAMGSLLKKYPAAEDEIVKSYLSGSQEDYNYGKEILKKYSYDKNLSPKNNSSISSSFDKLYYASVIIFAVLAVIILGILIISFNMIYKKIRKISFGAEAIVENTYGPLEGDKDDGDFGLLIYQFNTMAERLNENVEALKREKIFLNRLITDISHQLKTPLASLIMFNEILSDSKSLSQEELEKFLKESKNQLERIEWLIKNLLKMAKLEAGIVFFEKQNAPIIDTIRKSMEGLRTLAEAKDISVDITGDYSIVISHNINWTAEAVSNIIKNSIEHINSNGRIAITLEENNVFAQIMIEDNGEGISKEELPLIFDRFHKGPNSSNPINLGIGLFIAKTVIEGQGGSIYAYSTEGSGSKFVIRLMKKVWDDIS